MLNLERYQRDVIVIGASAGGVPTPHRALRQSRHARQHPSMPRNAIARDYVAAALPVSEMPAVLAALADGRAIELRAPATA